MVIRIPLKMKYHSWVLSKIDGITILIVMTFNKSILMLAVYVLSNLNYFCLEIVYLPHLEYIIIICHVCVN